MSAQLAPQRRGDSAARAPGGGRAPRPRARLVEIYKLGRGRYLRLLLSTSDIRRVGQATRTVAALAHIDRDRVAEHQQTIARVEGRARRARGAAAPGDGRPHRSQARGTRGRSRGRRARRAHPGHRPAARPERPAHRRTAGRAAEAAARAAQPRHRHAGDGGRRPAAPPVPRRSRLAGRPARCGDGSAAGQRRGPRRPTASRSPPPKARRSPAVHDGVVAFADRFAGFGNLVILDHGSQSFSLYGNLLEIAVTEGRRASSAARRVGTVGAVADRAGRPLLRAARRRSAGRSLTMAEETLEP